MLDDHLCHPPEATPAERRRLDARFSNLTEGMGDAERQQVFARANGFVTRYEWEEVRDLLSAFEPQGGDLEAELKASGQLAHGAGYLRVRGEPLQREGKLGSSHAAPRGGTNQPTRVPDRSPAVTSRTRKEWLPDVWLSADLIQTIRLLAASMTSALDGQQLSDSDLIALSVAAVRGVLVREQERLGRALHPLELIVWFQQAQELGQPARADLAGGNETPNRKGNPK